MQLLGTKARLLVVLIDRFGGNSNQEAQLQERPVKVKQFKKAEALAAQLTDQLRTETAVHSRPVPAGSRRFWDCGAELREKPEAQSQMLALVDWRLGVRSIVNRNRKGKERESIDFDKKTETSGSGEAVERNPFELEVEKLKRRQPGGGGRRGTKL